MASLVRPTDSSASPWPMSCVRQPSDHLQLSLVSSIATELRQPPTTLVRRSDGSFVILDEAHVRVSQFGRTWGLLGGTREVNPTGVTLSSDTLFVFSDSVVFAIAESGASTKQYSSSTGIIRHVAVINGYLWLIEKRSSGQYALYVVDRSEAPPTSRQISNLPGPGYVLPAHGGGVLYGQSTYPYRLVWYDRNGFRFHFDSLSEVRFPPESDIRFVHSLPPISLGCGYVLQTLADMRTDMRWLVIREGATGRVFRQLELTDPMALSQVNQLDSLIFGFRDAPGRREILLFQWAWEQDAYQASQPKGVVP